MLRRLSITARGRSRRDAQLTLAALCGLAVIAGVSGLTATMVFRQTGNLKWVLAFGGPLALLFVLNSRQPLRLLVGAVIVAAPFGSLRATFSGVAIPFFAVLLVTTIATAILTGPRPRRLSPLGAAGIVGAVLLAIPLVSGAGVSAHVILIGTAALVAWLISAVAREPGGMRFVLGSLVVAGLVQAAIAIWEVHTSHQVNFYGSAGSAVFGSGYFFGFDQTFRPIGSFYDPIGLGNVLGLAMPVGLVLAVGQESVGKRLLGTAAIGVIAVGLLLSLSRMSWVGGAAGLVLATLLLPPHERRRGIMVLLPLGVILALVVAGVGGTSIGDRFSSVFHPRAAKVSTATGDQQRVEQWAASLKIWASQPVAGAGLGNMAQALATRLPYTNSDAQAQSTYLQLLGEGGILGAGALVLLLLTQARVLFHGLRSSHRTIAAGLAGATLALMVEWTTDVSVRYTPVAACMAVLFGAAAGLWHGLHRLEEAESAAPATGKLREPVPAL
jgi:O-antigen ligase